MPEQPVGGAGVRLARRRAGLTLRQLAADLGVSAGTMSAIENGKVGLTVDRLQRIAQRLGVTAGELLEPTAPPRPGPPPVGPPPSPASSWREFGPLALDPVLGSAVEVFNETGYHGATMRVIATGAGISIAGMYHHHPSKQLLLVALLDLALADLHRRVTAAHDEADAPARALANAVEALALFHLERAELAHLVLTEMRSVEEPHRTRLAGVRRRVQDVLDAAAARVAGPGAGDDLPTVTRAITTMCLALPYWSHEAGPRGPADAARLAARYAALALDMLRPDRPEAEVQPY
ncbi:TetR family transcriptional regulator [Pseudonocardia lacus]|uniref:TetR family transcriptional regulator n=1 Tax=Pseudonocardia lacus TaxID=2835865 RepID=UPI001BDC9169|nr:TetR family transcriptional regulator [Pseudonocardia lacus]